MQIRLRPVAFSVLGVALAVGAAGCGSKAASPLSPSPADAATATIQGTVDTGGGAGSSSLGASSNTSGNLRVSVVGTGVSTTTDSSGRFTLSGIPGGAVTLRFEGPGVDARLEISGLQPGQVLTITVHVSGSNASLTPGSESSPSPSPSPSPGPGDDDDESEVEFTGVVESITPPSLVVAGRLVLTDANTDFKGKGSIHALEDLSVGDTVEVEAVLNADGSLLAREIKRKETAGDDDDDSDDDSDEDSDDDSDDDNDSDGDDD